jgi:hypothetical protein
MERTCNKVFGYSEDNILDLLLAYCCIEQYVRLPITCGGRNCVSHSLY